MKKLFVNMVYEWTDQEPPLSLERLLWIESDVDWVWCIKIYGKSARPVRRRQTELEQAFENGTAVVRRDPYAHLSRPESAIKERHRKYRDDAWRLIAPLVENNDTCPFQFYERDSPIAARIKATGCSKSKMYREIRHYFQRGQIKNGLLPLFDNCGWRNRLEDQEKERPPKKLGRPSVLSAATGEPRGVNITKDIRQAFRAGIKLFYLVREKPPLRRAFQLTRERFFNSGYKKNRDGVLVPILPPSCTGTTKSDGLDSHKSLVMEKFDIDYPVAPSSAIQHKWPMDQAQFFRSTRRLGMFICAAPLTGCD